MKRISEIQKLKERIIQLDDVESDSLFVWFSAVRDVRREMSRTKTPKLQQPTVKGNASEQPNN